MHNELLKIGPITIYGYGLMIGLGVVAALLIGEYRAKKKGLNGDFIYGLTILTVVLGFLSAKLLYTITEWSTFISDPMQIISGNGFVVFGGIIGGIATIWFYCKWKKEDPVLYMDLMVPSVAIAQGFGRIGCFLAGCCYGHETECAIGITFRTSQFAPNNVSLMPTQLIMSVGNFVIAGILFWFSRREYKKGQVGALYLILYSVGRFFVEYLRDDFRGSIGPFSTSQFIGIFTCLFGLVMFFVISPKLQQKEKI